MCNPHMTTRVSCLDHCFQSGLNTDGRLVEIINRTTIKNYKIKKSIAQKCRKKCTRTSCYGTFYGSVMYKFPYNVSVVGLSSTEIRLVTSPKMAFDELLINLLQVIGILLGLSVSDCFRFLANGLIWLNTQRISLITRPNRR